MPSFDLGISFRKVCDFCVMLIKIFHKTVICQHGKGCNDFKISTKHLKMLWNVKKLIMCLTYPQ